MSDSADTNARLMLKIPSCRWSREDEWQRIICNLEIVCGEMRAEEQRDEYVQV